MKPDNPAALPCKDIDRGPMHQWVRRADGTASCLNCGIALDVAQTADAFPPDAPASVSRKAGADAAKK